jgi:hypothetical protein
LQLSAFHNHQPCDSKQLAALDMSFEIDDDCGGLGTVKTVDLLRGIGPQRKILTRGDVNQYIHLVVRYWMYDRIQQHIEHIRSGINDVVRFSARRTQTATYIFSLL